jgi:hypothetical protein
MRPSESPLVQVALADRSHVLVRVPHYFRAVVGAYRRVLQEREAETGELLRQARSLRGARAKRLASLGGHAPERVLDDRPPLLVGYAGAATLLGTTVSALKSRVSRGDNKLRAAMVTNGRSVRFSVAKLTERFSRAGRRRT